LFINPDTEFRIGTLADLVRLLDERPTVGAVGVRQVDPEGELIPTARWLPGPMRALAEALGSERSPIRAKWMGQRELRLDRYNHEFTCEWVSGSFVACRREA